MVARAHMILARRTRPDEVVVFKREGHRVGLDEPEWIARLRHDIHAENVRVGPRAMQAHRSTAGATKKVEHLHGSAFSTSSTRRATKAMPPLARTARRNASWWSEAMAITMHAPVGS